MSKLKKNTNVAHTNVVYNNNVVVINPVAEKNNGHDTFYNQHKSVALFTSLSPYKLGFERGSLVDNFT